MLDIRVEPATVQGYKGLASQAAPVARLADFIWTPYERPCWHCEEPTTWVDVGFEAPLHPGPCSEAKWGEYAWAEALANLRERLADLRKQVSPRDPLA